MDNAIFTILIKSFLIFLNISALLLLFWFLMRKENISDKQTLRFINKTIFILVSLLVTQYIIYADSQYIEPNWISVEKINIRNKSFPKELSNLKIIHITDPHIKRVGFRENSMVKKINALNPDIILITGDFIIEQNNLPTAKYVLSQLRTKKGIYGVYGDNDLHAASIQVLKDTFEESGIRILDDENIRIPVDDKVGLWIIGLTHQEINGEVMQKAYAGVNLGEPKIVITHYPEFADTGYNNPEHVDLILSGGTHGGQVGIPLIRNILASRRNIKYMNGLFHVKGVPLYVNRGIGTIGDGKDDSTRFFCRPEITIIKMSQGK